MNDIKNVGFRGEMLSESDNALRGLLMVYTPLDLNENIRIIIIK